jgi:drug/metabolite transporter (DMT)-like permease
MPVTSINKHGAGTAPVHQSAAGVLRLSNVGTTMQATFFGIGALLLWSLAAVLTLAAGPVPPFQMIATTLSVTFLIALAKWLLTGESVIARLRVPFGALTLGVTGFFGFHALYFLALRLAPTVQTNLLIYLWPLLIVLFSALLPGERLTARHGLAGLAGLSGVALMILGGGGATGFSVSSLPGYLAAVACAVSWASYSVASRRYKDVPSDAVGVYCLITAVLAMLCHIVFETTVWPSAWQWVALLSLGAGPLGIAFFAWDRACKFGHIRALGIFAYAVPLLSNGLLLFYAHTPLTPRLLAAATLIIGGAALGAGDLWVKRANDPTDSAAASITPTSG